MDPDIDPTYEYNAPKFVDFLNMQDDDQADEWFDLRPGDDGGIPMEYSELEPSSVVVDPNTIRQYLDGIPTNQTMKVKEEKPEPEPPVTNPAPCLTESSDVPQTTSRSADILMSAVQQWAKQKPEVAAPLIKPRTRRPLPILTVPDTTVKATEHTPSTKLPENDTASEPVEAEMAPVVEAAENMITKEESTSATAPDTGDDKSAMQPPPPPRRGNIVTSIEEWNKKKGKILSAAKTRTSPKPKAVRESKRKRSSTTENKDVNNLNESLTKKRRSESGSGVAAPTIPKTPEVLKRQTNFTKPIIKTSEQMELERIERERQEAARRKERLMKYYKNKIVQQPVLIGGVRSVQQLTKPEEFHLKTDERIKRHPPSPKPACKEAPKSFPEYLRSNDTDNKTWKNHGPTIVKPFSFDKPVAPHRRKSEDTEKPIDCSLQADKWKNRAPTKPIPFSFDKGTSPAKKTNNESHNDSQTTTEPWRNRGPTVPMPFSFDQPRRRKFSEGSGNDSDGYESVAKAVYNFQKTTPLRFRSRPIAEQNAGPQPVQIPHPVKPTEPKTPQLSTKERVRPVSSDVLSKEQQEQLVEEEMKNYHFKARKFDQNIVRCNGILGVPLLQRKHPTVPKEFNFKYDERAEVHKQKDMSMMDIEDKSEHVIKANPVPAFVHKEPKKPELQHKKTEPAPFSFDQRDKQKLASKEAKIQEILEEEKRMHEFHAQPLPSLSPQVLEKNVKPATKCEPFNFNIDNRAEYKAKEWAERVQQEYEEQRRKAVFKAQPVNIPAPFIPKKSNKPPTDISEFKLNVDRRAVEREALDAEKKKIEEANEKLRQQMQIEQEEEEARNIAILRKNLVHKPNPMRKYKPVRVKPSDVPLTRPQSPAWSEYKRAKLR